MGNHFFYFGYMGKQKGTKRTMGGQKGTKRTMGGSKGNEKTMGGSKGKKTIERLINNGKKSLRELFLPLFN